MQIFCKVGNNLKFIKIFFKRPIIVEFVCTKLGKKYDAWMIQKR